MAKVGDYSSTLLPNVDLFTLTSSNQYGQLKSWCLFLFVSILKGMHVSAWLAGISGLSHGRTCTPCTLNKARLYSVWEKGRRWVYYRSTSLMPVIGGITIQALLWWDQSWRLISVRAKRYF